MELGGSIEGPRTQPGLGEARSESGIYLSERRVCTVIFIEKSQKYFLYLDILQHKHTQTEIAQITEEHDLGLAK